MSLHKYNPEHKLETPTAWLYADEDGLVHCDFKSMVNSLDDAIEHQRLAQEEMGDLIPHYTLADIRQVKQTSKEVRQYFGGEAVKATTAATAILVGTGISKIVGNIFLKFSSPIVPTRLFSDEEKAKAWLLEQKKA